MATSYTTDESPATGPPSQPSWTHRPDTLKNVSTGTIVAARNFSANLKKAVFISDRILYCVKLRVSEDNQEKVIDHERYIGL